MNLVDKIAAHLLSEITPTKMQKLQADLLKVRDARANEVITLKTVNGTIKESQLMAALREKMLIFEDLLEDNSISLATLRKHNIHIS